MATTLKDVSSIRKAVIACVSLIVVYWVSGSAMAALDFPVREAVSQERSVAYAFEDPLDVPAKLRTSVAGRPMMALANAGDKLVVVGMRGFIAMSGDNGMSWQQSKVPVQTDLLSVVFPTASDGWAVGHSGVVLHSADGGGTWGRQLDGRFAAMQLTTFYQRRIAAGETALQPYLDQLTLNFRGGPTLPFLSVWFQDANRGFAVGAFGMIVGTEDSGKTWQPWLDRIDNSQFLHLNAVRGIGGDVFIVGERGTVFKLNRKTDRFVAIPTQYPGSFFGIVGNERVLMAYGLRGAVYRSVDRGATWSAATVPLQSLITGATFDDAQGRFVFVAIDGQTALCDASGEHFRIARSGVQMPITSIGLTHGGALIVTGLNGVRSIAVLNSTLPEER